MTEKKDKKPAAQKAADNRPPLIRLAGARVPKALKAIALVGNLGNYGPNAAQVEAIRKELVKAVNIAVERLAAKSATRTMPTFELPGEEKK